MNAIGMPYGTVIDPENRKTLNEALKTTISQELKTAR